MCGAVDGDRIIDHRSEIREAFVGVANFCIIEYVHVCQFKNLKAIGSDPIYFFGLRAIVVCLTAWFDFRRYLDTRKNRSCNLLKIDESLPTYMSVLGDS